MRRVFVALLLACWALLAGAQEGLVAAGVAATDVTVIRVPGAFEIPMAAQRAADTGRFAAIICLGCLIRGATPHFEYISSSVAHGLQSVAAATGVPLTFGVLTTNSAEEALERAVAAGAQAASSPRAVAAGSEVVITMLPDGPEVEAAVLGPDGAILGFNPGSILVEMSTIDPSVTRAVGAKLAARGVRMVDSPVGKTSEHAVGGTAGFHPAEVPDRLPERGRLVDRPLIERVEVAQLRCPSRRDEPPEGGHIGRLDLRGRWSPEHGRCHAKHCTRLLPQPGSRERPNDK